MTREEAIRKLQKQKAEYLDEWVDFSGIAEAYDMAIEALSIPIMEYPQVDGITPHLIDEPKDRLIKFFADNLTEEEIAQGEEYARGYADGLKEQIQQTDTDLISRAKVLNVVQNADDGNIPYEVIKDIIQGLPSVSAERVGEWIPLDGKLPKIIGGHVLVTIKWSDDDLEVCEMCPTVADRYNIIAFQDLPEPYKGEPINSELQCDGAKMKGGNDD